MKNYIECKICNKQMKQITSQHLKIHGLTVPKYKDKHGPILSEDTLAKCEEAAARGRPLAAIVNKERSRKLQEAGEKQYILNPNKCLCCHDPLSYASRFNKYCSHSCSAKVSNTKRRKHPIKPIKSVICQVCNKKTKSKSEMHSECSKVKCLTCQTLIVPNVSKMCRSCYIKSDLANEQRGRTFSKTRGYYESKFGTFYYMSKLELDFIKGCEIYNIPLTKPNPLFYIHEGKKHLYFPDFLVDGTTIETKGYLTKEDRIKMSYFPDVKILFSKDVAEFVSTGKIPGV
jgi:hypothetical protein